MEFPVRGNIQAVESAGTVYGDNRNFAIFLNVNRHYTLHIVYG
jgi:hypothetical protein